MSESQISRMNRLGLPTSETDATKAELQKADLATLMRQSNEMIRKLTKGEGDSDLPKVASSGGYL